jgi:translation initiation factor 3 subunit D
LNPAQLQRFEEFKFFDNITTSQDEKLKQNEKGGNVFITERILSVIMTMIYNSRPWHIKISKRGENIYFDSTPESEIDLITVNESAEEMPLDDNEKAGINSFQNLSIEATLINEFIKEQNLDLNIPYEEEQLEPHPFTNDTENLEHAAYRYRIFSLSDLDIVVRAQVHAFNYDENGNPIFVNIYALNEFNVN